MARIPELAAADSSIISRCEHILDPSRRLVCSMVKFTSDMTAEGIKHIIRAAVRKGQACIRELKLTEASGIVFLPHFTSWPGNTKLWKQKQAIALTSRVLQQGWNALNELPFHLWHVKCFWQLIGDRTISYEIRQDLLSAAIYLDTIQRQSSTDGQKMTSREFFLRSEVEVAYNRFRVLYPELFQLPSP